MTVLSVHVDINNFNTGISIRFYLTHVALPSIMVHVSLILSNYDYIQWKEIKYNILKNLGAIWIPPWGTTMLPRFTVDRDYRWPVNFIDRDIASISTAEHGGKSPRWTISCCRCPPWTSTVIVVDVRDASTAGPWIPCNPRETYCTHW